MVITKGLPGKYTAVQMHLHWGGWDLEASGAEHTVDGIRYMAEVVCFFFETILFVCEHPYDNCGSTKPLKPTPLVSTEPTLSQACFSDLLDGSIVAWNRTVAMGSWFLALG